MVPRISFGHHKSSWLEGKDNRDKRHKLSPRIDIKISDPAGNRTRAVVLEGWDFTVHVTVTDTVETGRNILCRNIFATHCT